MRIPAICIARKIALKRLLRIHRINDTVHIHWRFPWDGRDYL